MNTKIFSKGTNPLSPKVNVGLKAQGKTEIFNIDMWGKGGFTKVFKCFEKRCLGRTEKCFGQKARSYVLPTASLRSVLAAKRKSWQWVIRRERHWSPGRAGKGQKGVFCPILEKGTAVWPKIGPDAVNKGPKGPKHSSRDIKAPNNVVSPRGLKKTQRRKIDPQKSPEREPN